MPLGEIKLNPKNRNKHPDAQIDRIAEIIKYQGFRRPGTISNRTGLLVCGEGRYLAAKKLGAKEMPIIYQDYDDEAQELADAVADNALDKWAELDLAGIQADLSQFDDFDIDMLGLKDFTLDVTEKFDLDEKPDSESTGLKHILEVEFKSLEEMTEVYDDLLSRGYIVRSR